MSDAAKRGHPSKRDVDVLNDEESTSDQPAKKSVKKEEESVPSTQVVCLQQEMKENKSESKMENNALKSQIERLTTERAELQARSRMPQESASDLLDGMEKQGETSFTDLPDDILIRFFKDLDFPSCLKLRLNKKLERLQMCVANELYGIDLTISLNHYELTLGKSGNDQYIDFPRSPRSPRQYHDFHQLVQGLDRLSVSTIVSYTYAHLDANEHNCRIIEALSNFETRVLTVYSPLNMSILRNFAQNVGELSLDFTCTGISAQDLCTIRKIMIEGDCKLEYFSLVVEQDMEKSFVKECFGVTIEEVGGRNTRVDVQPIWTKIYRTTDESIQFYGDVFSSYSHFEDKLRTTIARNIVFCKRTFKPKHASEKIRLNHLYSRY